MSSTSSVSTAAGSPISVSGLASGLDTKSIISALLEAEKAPITRLTEKQERTTDQQTALTTIQSNLLKLTYAIDEFKLPSILEGVQTVTSSEPARVTATVGSGAGVGGYELEVTQLASSAKRSFTFTAPAAEETLTVGGREYTVKAGSTAAELASKINADGKSTVYAAVSGETIVLSSRTTGAGSLEAVTVAGPGTALKEVENSAKEGKDAEYKLDGVAGTSSTNVVTGAIAGVTLTLESLTGAGPVTIAVNPPEPNVKAIETQVNSFISLYNSTVEAIQTQLSTKPIAGAVTAEEAEKGTLFGDRDLSNLLYSMRESMYEPIAGLTGEVTSPGSIGISTGAPSGSAGANPGALAGLLKLEPAKLEGAIASNPEGVASMLTQWSTNLNKAINEIAAPGGTLEVRINGDEEQVREMKGRIETMNEMLALHKKALEQTYAQLEGVISHNSAIGSWLTEQSNQLAANAKG